jgi:hypothetical protein
MLTYTITAELHRYTLSIAGQHEIVTPWVPANHPSQAHFMVPLLALKDITCRIEGTGRSCQEFGVHLLADKIVAASYAGTCPITHPKLVPLLAELKQHAADFGAFTVKER